MIQTFLVATIGSLNYLKYTVSDNLDLFTKLNMLIDIISEIVEEL